MSGIGDLIRGAVGEMRQRVERRSGGTAAQGGMTALPTAADFNRYKQQAIGPQPTGTPARQPQSGMMYTGGTPGFNMRGGPATGPKPGGMLFHPAMMNQLMQSMAPQQPPPRINAQGLFSQLMASMGRRG